MNRVPDDLNRGWAVKIDGVESDARLVEISSARFGTVTYGERNGEGFDTFTYKPIDGNGAVTLPYSYDDQDRLLIGLLLEERPNLSDELVPSIVGGFKEPGESAQGTQVREADEETGLDTVAAHKLPGLPVVQDRFFWHTNPGEGVESHALEIAHSRIEQSDDGYWRLKPTGDADLVAKQRLLVFMPAAKAIIDSPDAMARAAIAQLLVFLKLI
jgi:ADP-ribose pyrophosphatase YjhB (NUDIX family)